MVDFKKMQEKANAHEKAARRWKKAIRAYSDAMIAESEAREIEQTISDFDRLPYPAQKR